MLPRIFMVKLFVESTRPDLSCRCPTWADMGMGATRMIYRMWGLGAVMPSVVPWYSFTGGFVQESNTFSAVARKWFAVARAATNYINQSPPTIGHFEPHFIPLFSRLRAGHVTVILAHAGWLTAIHTTLSTVKH